MNKQRTSVVPIVETMSSLCEQGHEWQPTIIIGYFHCSRCDALAACTICVPKLRGKPLAGVCQQHRHHSNFESEQEVLA